MSTLNSKGVSRSLLSALIFSLIVLGLISGVFSQTIITRTRTLTSFETVAGETIVTTVVVEGGEKAITVVNPGFVIVGLMVDSERTCVVIFRALTEVPEQTISITGTTFSVPGATISTVVRERTIAFTSAYTELGWTTTYTGAGPTYTATFSYDDFEMTFELPSYGELREMCGARVVSNVMTVIFRTAPATFYMAFPGFTMTIPDMVFTIPGMTLDIEPFTTTYTSVIPGTTEVFTTTYPDTTLIETVTLPAGTFVSTVVRGGSTLTKLVYVVETVTIEEEEEATTTTPTTVTTPATTTPAPTTQTLTTAPQPQPGQIDILVVAVVVAAIAVVVAAVAFSLRRRR